MFHSPQPNYKKVHQQNVLIHGATSKYCTMNTFREGVTGGGVIGEGVKDGLVDRDHGFLQTFTGLHQTTDGQHQFQ